MGAPVAAFDGFSDIWTEVVAKADQDPAFRLRLTTMPLVVLNQYGAGLPSNLNVHIVEGHEAPEGGWAFRRHGDKTTLVLALPSAVRQTVRA
jgi:hypothetical protein